MTLHESGPDLNPLINPPKVPGPKATCAIDILSWALPALAALLSVIGGVVAFEGFDKMAAILGTVAGLASAIGIIFTGKSSKIRDYRLAYTHALSELTFSQHQDLERRTDPGPGMI